MNKKDKDILRKLNHNALELVVLGKDTSPTEELEIFSDNYGFKHGFDVKFEYQFNRRRLYNGLFQTYTHEGDYEWKHNCTEFHHLYHGYVEKLDTIRNSTAVESYIHMGGWSCPFTPVFQTLRRIEVIESPKLRKGICGKYYFRHDAE